MPGVDRLSIAHAVDEAGEAAALGIPAVLLFGLPAAKDEEGSGAWDDEGIVQLATRAIKEAHPDLLVITDLCLCEYTSHGHCGVVRQRRRGRQRRHARAARPHGRLPGASRRRHRRAERHDGRPRRRDPRARSTTTASPTRRSSRTRPSSPPPSTARSARPPTRRRRSATAAATRWIPANGDEAVREARARRRGGRRHRDGQAGAPLPRPDPPRSRTRRRCRWPPTTSAASTRWSRPPPRPATSTSAPPCSRR